MTEAQTDTQYFAKLIKEIKFVMLTTFVPTIGKLYSRPMTLPKTEFDGDLWFFAGLNSDLVRQITNTSSVNLTFSNPKSMSFISAAGNAFNVIDPRKMKELWNPMYKAWFPEGLNDPNLGLIKVEVETVDYWESPSSKMVTLVNFAKTVLGVKTDEAALGTHGHFDLH